MLISSVAFAQQVAPNELQRAQTLFQQEAWADLGRFTETVGNIQCGARETNCLHLMVIRSEYLYASRQFDAALALLNKLHVLRASNDHDSDWEYIEQLVTLSRGVGERHAGLLRLANLTLSGLIAQPLRESVRVRALGEMAYVMVLRGEHELARKLYEEQIILAQKLQDEGSELYGGVGLALIAKDRAEYHSALLQFLALVKRMEPENQTPTYLRRLGFVHANVAALYKQIGQLPLALQHYHRARNLVRQVDAQLYKADYGDMIASAHRLMGNHDEALRVLNQEYIPFETQPLRLYVAHREMALNFVAKGAWVDAATHLQKAIDIRLKAGNVRHIGDYFADLGSLKLNSGNAKMAISNHIEGLVWSIQQVDPESQWKNSFGMFRSLKATGDISGAIFWGKQTVNILSLLRANLNSADGITQSTYLRHVEHVYEELATILIDSGRIVEAEQILAMRKERELGELVRSATDAQRTQVDYMGVERKALAEQQRLAATDVATAAELVALDKRAVDLSPQEEQRRQALIQLAHLRRAEYQRYLTGLGEMFAQAGRRGEERQAKTETTRLQTKVALDPAGAVGLHYVVTDDRVGIIVATPGGSFGRFSAVSRTALNQHIAALRQAIVDKADTRVAAQALWQVLIAPVQADLQAAGAKTLVLSLTDTLRYLPFAALQDAEGRYLVQDYALSLWAAAVDVKPAASTQSWQVAGLGLTQAKTGFKALPAVRSELQGIVRTSASPTGLLPGSISLDEAFGRSEFEAALHGQNNVVHVASHFDFRPGDESRSVLLMGKGSETLSLGQLAVMNFSNVDLLTLSACETATGGGINENGAEVEGLAAVVLDAKAQAVLASLWKVADDSTASLMREFYARWVQASIPISRAQALRQAQLALLNGSGYRSAERATNQRSTVLIGRVPGTAAASVDPKRPWAHPYYWAPFVLSGNWL